MTIRSVAELNTKNILQNNSAIEIMEYHRRMVNEFLAFKYVVRKTLHLYKYQTANEYITSKQISDERNKTKSSVQQLIDDIELEKYKSWLKSNYKNDERSGTYRRFLDELESFFDENQQELDTVKVTGYALSQNPYNFNNTVYSASKVAPRNIFIKPFDKKDYERKYKKLGTVSRGSIPAFKPTQIFAEASKSDIGIKDITDIALTTLSFLSFGVFILQVLACITIGKHDTSNIIFTHSATQSTMIDGDEIEEIRRIKRSSKNIPGSKTLNILVRKSLRAHKLFFNTTGMSKSCYYYRICESSELARKQSLDNIFWILIWSSGSSWITSYKRMASRDDAGEHIMDLEILRAVIIGILGKDSCKNYFQNACLRESR
ncbi:uncharacterized protein LOC129244898 [Anastrepha obliqua]|uniref:uncharacterized protein LOC129244898 n=1 Tax=Anastrepha obliqua TaxID=95512 RepID=UPI0024094F33|nr:uncharacterized protein LOC129244898 [Anastrepha obliqua]